jgi:NDP-sugar pyrophosphorylase family protein
MTASHSADGSSSGAATGLKAVILAGGKGTRLHPFSVSFPKPLMPLGERPVLEVLLRRLTRFGVRDICLTLGHLGELVRAYFDHRRKLLERINLRYVQEETPTGTAGSLASVENLDSTFLVMNGDLLTNLDFDALVHFHRQEGAALTIATHTRTVKIDLGVLEFDAQQRITGYREKPVSTYHVSMGIYVYEPRVLEHIEAGKYLDFPDLVHRLLDKGERVCAYPTDCLWLDIGRPDDYAKAQELFAEKKEAFEHV